MSADDGIQGSSLRKVALIAAGAAITIALLAAATGGPSRLPHALFAALACVVIGGTLYVGLVLLAAWWPVIGPRQSVRAQLSYELNWLGFTHCRHCAFNLLGRTTSQCPECGQRDAVVFSETAPYRSFHIVRQIGASPTTVRQAFTDPALRDQWWPLGMDENRGLTILLCSGPQDQLVFCNSAKAHYTIVVQVSAMGESTCVSWLHTSSRAYDMCDPGTDPHAVHARLVRLASILAGT